MCVSERVFVVCVLVCERGVCVCVCERGVCVVCEHVCV